MQWLQDPNQSNLDHINYGRCKLADISGPKTKEYTKTKIELETNNNIKNIIDLYRGISDFKEGYQPRSNIIKDEKGDLVSDIHSILARRKNHFSQLLNVQGGNDARQTEICTAEPIVPEPSAFQVEMANEKLKRHKSPGIGQIPAELIKTGGRTIHSENHKLINSIWNKQELPEEWKESIIVPISKGDCSNYTGISLVSTTHEFYPPFCCQC